jgi:hypothetical protein
LLGFVYRRLETSSISLRAFISCRRARSLSVSFISPCLFLLAYYLLLSVCRTVSSVSSRSVMVFNHGTTCSTPPIPTMVFQIRLFRTTWYIPSPLPILLSYVFFMTDSLSPSHRIAMVVFFESESWIPIILPVTRIHSPPGSSFRTSPALTLLSFA